MASIYKRGKSWTYKVYYYENGKQKAVSKTTLHNFFRRLSPYSLSI